MLKIGWATRDMTPPRPVLLHGQFYVRVSTHVNDPLTVTALAIESTGKDGRTDCAIMLSCDLVHIPTFAQDRVRELVKDRLPGFDLRKLFANGTHTHTGPAFRDDLYPKQGPEVMSPEESLDLFARKAADAAVSAWQNRKAASVSWAFGQAVVGHNRRAVYFDGSAAMYGKTDRPDFEHIEGYEDHSLNLLFTWDADRRLTGMVVNLACPSQVTENAFYVSADYWHETRLELRERFGADLPILPQCSAAGDQSPHFLVYSREEEYMRKRRDLSERQEIARRIAAGVDDVFATAQSDIRTDMPFKHIVEPLQLPARIITDEEYRAACADYEQILKDQAAGKDPGRWRSWHSMLRRARDVQTRYQNLKTHPFFDMELHVLRLGDVAFATNPFELFLDYGLRMKARSKALQTFVVQLAAGSGAYLPTSRALAAKSYGAGAADNLVGPEGGQILVDRTVELISGLWSD